jgi:hypothetical protein
MIQAKEVKSMGKVLGSGFASFVKPRQWKDWKSGEVLKASFENLDNVDRYGKPIYGFKVIESSFGAEVGSMIYLNCGGNFKKAMDEASLEDRLIITYKGMNKMGPKSTHPGTMTHSIEVVLDDSSNETSDDLI